MKTIPLSQGFVAIVDDADYPSVSAHKWSVTKTKRCNYAIRKSGPTSQLLHRFILGITDRKVQVDHKDHDGLNCQRENLRSCTRSQNNANRLKKPGCLSQFKGIWKNKKRNNWRAQIVVRGKRITLGTFLTEMDAALAYDAAARLHFGEFAHCNFPPKKPSVSSAPACTITSGWILH